MLIRMKKRIYTTSLNYKEPNFIDFIVTKLLITYCISGHLLPTFHLLHSNGQ